MIENSISVCIPTIPPRAEKLHIAVASVQTQTLRANELCISLDEDGVGAATNRNNAWRQATSEWIAFVDDDDTIYPQHLKTLLTTALETGADLVYPWFDLWEGPDPLSVLHEGKYVSPLGVPFGDEAKNYILTEGNFIPITVLVRRSMLEQVNGFPQPNSEEWPNDHAEDWGCWQKMLRAGAKFVHAPERTWRWHWHGAHTSGRAWK